MLTRSYDVSFSLFGCVVLIMGFLFSCAVAKDGTAVSLMTMTIVRSPATTYQWQRDQSELQTIPIYVCMHMYVCTVISFFCVVYFRAKNFG